MNYKTDWSIIDDLIEDFNKYIKDDIDFYGDIDMQVYTFPQMWGSTALGYGGIGGSAITTAQTIVLYEDYSNIARVYFGGDRLAYQIKNPSPKFFEDLVNWNMVSVSERDRYRREDEITQ